MGFPIQDILKINDQVKKGVTEKLKFWNNLSVNRRGPKPKPEGYNSQQLGCMCMRMHCFNRFNGHGCLKCAMVCKKSTEQDNLDHPMLDNKLNCIFDVWECDCSVLYYRHEHKKVAVQLQIARALKINTAN